MRALGILEFISGLAGTLIIGFRFSWWTAAAIFLLMMSQNLHNEIDYWKKHR